MLFRERLSVPEWSDLAEPTRVEAVKLLARLMISFHKKKVNQTRPTPGECDD
jgi:hypothetical protein